MNSEECGHTERFWRLNVVLVHDIGIAAGIVLDTLRRGCARVGVLWDAELVNVAEP